MEDTQPKTSNRGKGHTVKDAVAHMEALPEEIKNALGPGGMNALKLVCQKAPGTYFHSVAILEVLPIRWQRPDYAAAVLLHDLGKVHHAHRYAENIIGESSRPEISILHAHVDGGRTLAQYYALPPLVQQAIEEHHGTMTTKGDEYPYRGRRPRSMFTAMLMIADKVEAITSSNKFSAELMQRIYEDCRAQGQFEHIDVLQVEDYLKLVVEQQEQEGRPRLSALDRLYIEESPALPAPQGPAHEGAEQLRRDS